MIDTAIVGAGPYGLSIAAHLRHKGLPFRIFGAPMDSWINHMPKGMMLKSDGFASNLYDPEAKLTLKQFCAERGIEYGDTKIPVSLETFAQYGLTFNKRLVPELENKMVVALETDSGGYTLALNTSERLQARRVILAVGITHFPYIPECISTLPKEFVSHTYQRAEVATYRGRRVVVIGGGASAIETAGFMQEAGADVTLVVRELALKFHSRPSDKPRTAWQQLRHPQSGLGPGLRSRFFAEAPGFFHYLPERLRLEAVRRHLGPSGHWISKQLIESGVSQLLGYSPMHAQLRDGKVALQLRASDETTQELMADHIVAGTGYKVSLERLPFLSPELRGQIKAVNGTPVLSRTFESTAPGLYFVGLAAASSFGPVMRFAFGAEFTAKSLTRTMTKLAVQGRAFSTVPQSEMEEVQRS
jgi:hypothetical protein